MKPYDIINYCLKNLDGTILVESWGERGIFYNPNHIWKRGVYVLAIKEKDGENDKGYGLNRKDIYRVNLGLKRPTFQKLFGPVPTRPAAGKVVDMPYNFTTINCLLPHPVYAWMGWVCILNPSESAFNKLKPLIQESYEFAIEKFKKRM
ncbi:MAG: hypothetical protein K2K81_04715 [Muribaculaceae bacterium]|nr:hypothetical protein [Muribaculaceae bacterium]